MPAYIFDNSLDSLSPDFKRVLEIQLSTFIDYLDEAAVRSRSNSKPAVMNTVPVTVAPFYRLRKSGMNHAA